jgi:hypothetical protein
MGTEILSSTSQREIGKGRDAQFINVKEYPSMNHVKVDRICKEHDIDHIKSSTQAHGIGFARENFEEA